MTALVPRTEGTHTPWKVLWGGCPVHLQEAGQERGAEGLGATGGSSDWRRRECRAGSSVTRSLPQRTSALQNRILSPRPLPPSPDLLLTCFHRGTRLPRHRHPSTPPPGPIHSPSVDPESPTSLRLSVFSCHLWASRVC